MIFTYDKLYRSMVYYVSQIIPSGVEVVDGESYGVRLSDPAGKSPSIAVTIENVYDKPLEMGSSSAGIDVVIHINALSRVQRDALKSIIYSGLLNLQIPVYNDFIDFTPTSFTIEQYLQVGDYFSIKDMPNFFSDREKFFWISVVFVTLDVIGMT